MSKHTVKGYWRKMQGHEKPQWVQGYTRGAGEIQPVLVPDPDAPMPGHNVPGTCPECGDVLDDEDGPNDPAGDDTTAGRLSS